jgi:hypothetical protein
MALRTIAASIVGLVHLVLWISIGPSAVADPGGWGPCPPRAMFPIEAPYPPGTFGFDLYVCEVQPRLIPGTAFTMLIAFGVSGAITLRLAKSSRLLVGAIPTVVLIAAWFATGWHRERILPLETAVAGISILTLCLGSALLGAAIARRMEPSSRMWGAWS